MGVSFSGGGLAGKYLADLAEKVEKASLVRVGFLEGATYEDGTSVPLVAAANEYGEPGRNQPPRPYFRNMIAAKSPEWGKDLGKIMKLTQMDSEQALQLMGQRIKDQLQESIRSLESPPLAPSTIAKKGFSKPLIETGHMLNSVDYEVK
jgi:hypothetical protein